MKDEWSDPEKLMKSPFGITIAYLESLVLIFKTMDSKSKKDDMKVNVGMLKDIQSQIGNLITDLEMSV